MQNEVQEKNSKQNYIIIILCTASIVLVFYLYQYQIVNIVVSYVGGCLACIFLFKTNLLSNYIVYLKRLLSTNLSRNDDGDTPDKQYCADCDGFDCVRHKSEIRVEPWQGLRIHKQLDQAIEDFYNAILDHFVKSWYSKITQRPYFLDELRSQLRYASSSLLRRAAKINYSKLIYEKLVPCALHHYMLYCEAQKQHIRVPNLTLEETAARGPFKSRLHAAVFTRNSEMRYLRCVSRAIMPLLLNSNETNNRVFQVLVREIFSGWVLLPLLDVLADPYILNTLVIIATDNDKLSELPLIPNYRVEFLENFVHRSESMYSQRSKLFKVDVDCILSNQSYFYSFMQYMKSIGKFHILQFTKEIKELQKRLLNAEMTTSQESDAMKVAWEIYLRYVEGPYSVDVASGIAKGFRVALAGSASALRTAPALYAAASHGDQLLTNTYIPMYLHSEEFYKLFLGSRVATGFSKRLKRPQEKSSPAARLSTKLKSALRNSTVDGQIFDLMSNGIAVANDSGPVAFENIDILRYLDILAEHAKLDENTLDKWSVQLKVSDDQKSDSYPRIFHVHVDKGDGTGCFVLRNDSDFHLLRDKLYEFHGQNSFGHTNLPHIRTNGPVEGIRYKYEDFIQQLLREPLLLGSDLLRLFLTAPDFSAACSNRASADGANVYQVLAHRLKKEKGQHLDAFMNAYLLSTDVERYQAMLEKKKPQELKNILLNKNVDYAMKHELFQDFIKTDFVTWKHGSTRDIEEGEEVSDTIHYDSITSHNPRSYKSDVFRDNFHIAPDAALIQSSCTRSRDGLGGFTHCFIFLLSHILKVRKFVVRALGALLSLCRSYVDPFIEDATNQALQYVLSERRLAKLIRLGHELLFGLKPMNKRSDSDAHREKAWRQLNECSPKFAWVVLGGEAQHQFHNLFEMFQYPSLNKQLLYQLFDTCLAELFPELNEEKDKTLEN